MFSPLVLAASTAVVTYLYIQLRHKRLKQYAHLPQLPPSLVWGHMIVYDEYTKRGKADRHPDLIFGAMHEALGSPPVMVVDMRPVSKPVALITSHDVAEQITKSTKLFPYSLPKTPSIIDLVHLIGPQSILSAEGEQWKTLRKRFAPGFAPSHLMTLLPCILDKMEPFVARLDRLVASGEEFVLEKLLSSLTIDIISAITMNEDLNAQDPDESKHGELIPVFYNLLKTYSGRHNLPWWLVPGLETKRRNLAKQIDQILQGIVRRKFAEHQSQEKPDARARSVLALSFKGTDELTPEVLGYTADQLRSFFLAGHDTTSILMGWTLYELSRNPHALKAVRAELDELCGPDPDPAVVRAKLYEGGEDLVRRMNYVSAVIKETLRLHPPASTARYAKPGTGFTVRTAQGDEYCLDGCIIYNCHTVLHRDRAVYGDTADDFLPERWLGDTDTSDVGDSLEKRQSVNEDRKFPPSAWRPFERGPRNCIGQELANLEARVLVAVTIRKYDFVKVGLGALERDAQGRPVLDDKGAYKVTEELYPMLQVTTKPVDGMKIKVKFAGDA